MKVQELISLPDSQLGGGFDEIHSCYTSSVLFVSLCSRGHCLGGESLSATTTKTRTRRTSTAKKSSAPKISVSDETISELTKVFKMLADDQRLKILLALAQEGELHVSSLCKLLDQSQPAVSHHLTLMRMTGVVGFNRKGKNNFYYLNSAKMRDILEMFFSDTSNSQKQLQFKEFTLNYKTR